MTVAVLGVISTVNVECAGGMRWGERRSPQRRCGIAVSCSPELNRDSFWCLSLYTGTSAAGGPRPCSLRVCASASPISRGIVHCV